MASILIVEQLCVRIIQLFVVRQFWYLLRVVSCWSWVRPRNLILYTLNPQIMVFSLNIHHVYASLCVIFQWNISVRTFLGEHRTSEHQKCWKPHEICLWVVMLNVIGLVKFSLQLNCRVFLFNEHFLTLNFIKFNWTWIEATKNMRIFRVQMENKNRNHWKSFKTELFLDSVFPLKW